MNHNPTKNIQLTEFDYLLADPHLQMMKAAIPYMQHPQQRMFSMIIKIQELQRTVNLFQDDVSAMGISGEPQRKASALEMLQAMKPYAPPQEQEMIEMLENLQIMLQAMQPSA